MFAWLIADGDMHLKNLALLRIAQPGERQFRSVRVAPLYDAVTTRVFPRLKHDRLALKLNGKNDNLQRADFRALATTAGLRVAAADRVIDDLFHRLRGAVDRIESPKGLSLGADGRKVIGEMLDLCRGRMKMLG